VYIYIEAHRHLLNPVAVGDHRFLMAGRENAGEITIAPLILLLVSNTSRFSIPERLRFPGKMKKIQWASLDAGMVFSKYQCFLCCNRVTYKTSHIYGY
jgi:hypothetical protein